MEFDYYTSGPLYEVHDLRVSPATVGRSFVQGRGHTARNVQLVRCQTALQGSHASFGVFNAVVHGVREAFTASGSGNTTGNLQHVTFNQCSNQAPSKAATMAGTPNLSTVAQCT